jgi:hypothetical protein
MNKENLYKVIDELKYHLKGPMSYLNTYRMNKFKEKLEDFTENETRLQDWVVNLPFVRKNVIASGIFLLDNSSLSNYILTVCVENFENREFPTIEKIHRELKNDMFKLKKETVFTQYLGRIHCSLIFNVCLVLNEDHPDKKIRKDFSTIQSMLLDLAINHNT